MTTSGIAAQTFSPDAPLEDAAAPATDARILFALHALGGEVSRRGRAWRALDAAGTPVETFPEEAMTRLAQDGRIALRRFERGAVVYGLAQAVSERLAFAPAASAVRRGDAYWSAFTPGAAARAAVADAETEKAADATVENAARLRPVAASALTPRDASAAAAGAAHAPARAGSAKAARGALKALRQARLASARKAMRTRAAGALASKPGPRRGGS